MIHLKEINHKQLLACRLKDYFYGSLEILIRFSNLGEAASKFCEAPKNWCYQHEVSVVQVSDSFVIVRADF